MKLKNFKWGIACYFCLPFLSYAQDNFNFYISNTGNDNYPGTSSLFPKKTITATATLFNNFFIANGSVKVGLKSGNTFEEQLVTSYPIQVGVYSDSLTKNNFAILNGSKEFNTGWIKENSTNYTFQQAIPYTGFSSGVTGYNYISVIEIDRLLEKTAPFIARKILTYVTGLDDVESIPGSFYIPSDTTKNLMRVFIHTSDGSSPDSNNRYRYEVTVRENAVNSTYQPNNKFENLWVRGYGAGYGMLPGGNDSYYNKIVFGPGAAIHHVVVRSGTIDHSLFLPGMNMNQFAVVFYGVEGLHKHCTIKNSIFLDITVPLYAHTSYGTNYGAVEMDNIVGFASKIQNSVFMYTSNNDTVLLNNIYADGYTSGYNYGTAKYVSINNSYFKDVNFGIAYRVIDTVASTVKNVFIKTKGTSNTTGIIMQANTSLTLSNSIIHIVNTKNANSRVGSFISGSGIDGNKIVSSGNIFICDIDPSATLVAASTNTDNGIATSTDKWNNNVYILLRGNKIIWTSTNASVNAGSKDIQNFDEWKRQSGQDKSSLYFDLRNDPRGLKAIFADPDNGNYDLANTTEGKQVAALHVGMITPLTCFLQKPTYEEAANIILNNETLSINTCRNPCEQNKIRVDNSFDISELNKTQIKLAWTVSEQQNISHYEIEKAPGNSVFKKIASIPVAMDSNYSFTDNVQTGISYQYRLSILAKAGDKCYSDIHSIKTNDDKLITIYPNPSTGKIFVSMNGYIGKANIIVSNSLGQPIFKKDVLSLYWSTELDFTNQSKGIYFIKIERSDRVSIQKFLLQ